MIRASFPERLSMNNLRSTPERLSLLLFFSLTHDLLISLLNPANPTKPELKRNKEHSSGFYSWGSLLRKLYPTNNEFISKNHAKSFSCEY